MNQSTLPLSSTPKADAKAAAKYYAEHATAFASLPSGVVPGLPSTWPESFRLAFAAGAAPPKPAGPMIPPPPPSRPVASTPTAASSPAVDPFEAIKSGLEALLATPRQQPLDADAVAAIARSVAESVLAEARVVRLEVGRPDAAPAQIDNPHPALARVLAWIGAGEPVWLVGPAGSGKTTIGAHVAEALGLAFYPVSCSAGMSEASLLGFVNPADGAFLPGPLLRAYEDGGLVLLDEIDAADANVLVAVNSALSNGHIGVPKRHAAPVARRHPNFRLIAAANTYGTGANAQYIGRNQLDAATLNRFVQVPIDYAPNVLAAACPDPTLRGKLDAIRRRIAEGNIRRIVSPRDYRRAAIAAQIGEDWREVVLAGWSAGERTTLGEAGK